MAKFRNISPLGALDIPALGRIVEAEEVFDVPSDLEEYFADQSANFEQVREPSPNRAELDALAFELGLDPSQYKNKAAIADAIAVVLADKDQEGNR